MKRFQLVLLIFLCLCLAGVILLRAGAKLIEFAPLPTAAPTASAAPTAATALTPAPAATAPTGTPAPTPTPYAKPKGYTQASYQLVSDMVYAYADRQEDAVDIIDSDLEQLNALDPALGALWGKIMALWSDVNRDFTLNPAVLPDGLPEDESLCIVVLGFQLEADGSMAPELLGRCETALACARKYPNARIAVTGGGTARQDPSATEAGVMAAWLTAHGVDAARIIQEDQSRTTADNAVFTCKILREQYPQIKSLGVVSSDYHVPLGVLLFQEQAYLDEYETGVLPFSVVSNAALDTGGRTSPDSPMMQKLWIWSVADPQL